MSKAILTNAVDLIERGQKDEAARILRKLLEKDPKNERAWLLLTACQSDVTSRYDCLERVLTINPKNQRARDWMDRIKSSRADIGDESVSSARNLQSTISFMHKAETGQGFILTKIKKLVVIFLAVGVLVVLSVLGFHVVKNQTNPESPQNSTFDSVPALLEPDRQPIVMPATWTPTAVRSTNTPRPTSSPMPTNTILVLPTFTPTFTSTIPPTQTIYIGVVETESPTEQPPDPIEPSVVPTRPAQPTSPPESPKRLFCWTDPAVIAVGYGGTLTVFADLQQDGRSVWVGALVAEWNDGMHSGHCVGDRSGTGPIFCQGHYFALPANRTVEVNVGVNDKDGRRFNCSTSYSTR